MTTAPATIELPDPRRTAALRLTEGSHSVAVLGRPTETNLALVAAFAELGCRSWLADPATLPRVRSSDVVLARLDVLPTLDGIERGLWKLPQLKRAGALVLNGPAALAAAHDKLSTALFLGRVGVDQPATAHVRDVTVPSFGPPYVVKPRFGSWGRDVHLCADEDELQWRLERLAQRRWFRRQGALVQALIQPTGRDLRILVARAYAVTSLRQPGACRMLANPGHCEDSWCEAADPTGQTATLRKPRRTLRDPSFRPDKIPNARVAREWSETRAGRVARRRRVSSRSSR